MIKRKHLKCKLLRIYFQQENLILFYFTCFRIKTSRKKRVKMRNKKEWIVRNGNQHISKEKNKRSLSFDLLYYQKSPNFCDFDASLEVPGTSGRECIRNSTGQDNCSSLCCGRGYNYVRQRRTERCNCKFIWCCKVECDTCVVEEWKSICNWSNNLQSVI